MASYRFALLALAACGSPAPSPAPPAPPAAAAPSPAPSATRETPAVRLPTRFEAHRFFVEPRTTSGAKMRLFTDTGGGLFLTAAAVERLGLELREVDGQRLAALPAFAADASIPPVVGFDDGLPVLDDDPAVAPFGDGMLGQAWFGGRIWTFDYGAGQLLLHPDGSSVPAGGTSVPLGFPVNDAGERGSQFPRIQARIDGQTIDFLLDTGATIVLSDAARRALDPDGASERATSFIIATTFDRWRREHPAWRVIENADASAKGEPMIEVPKVDIGGHEVGPVWFTRRADRNFHEFMSQWMDRRIDGALGGSALRYFRVTVDYPRAVALLWPLRR